MIFNNLGKMDASDSYKKKRVFTLEYRIEGGTIAIFWIFIVGGQLLGTSIT